MDCVEHALYPLGRGADGALAPPAWSGGGRGDHKGRRRGGLHCSRAALTELGCSSSPEQSMQEKLPRALAARQPHEAKDRDHCVPFRPAETISKCTGPTEDLRILRNVAAAYEGGAHQRVDIRQSSDVQASAPVCWGKRGAPGGPGRSPRPRGTSDRRKIRLRNRYRRHSTKR